MFQPGRIARVDYEELSRRLRTHVDRLAGLIGPRYGPRQMQLAADYIAAELSLYGHVERQEYACGDQQVANLVSERSGSRRDDQIVVVGAHYDTVEATPGADDNASAVAMLIEIARLLSDAKPDRTLRFVAFPCEEQPHFHSETMGSQVYARQCRAHQERVVGMICLEMVGYYSDEPGSQRIPPGIPGYLRWAFPRRGNFLAVVGNPRSWRLVWSFRRGFKRHTRLPLFSIVLPESIPEIRRSDNSSFWDQGYASVMVTDTSFLRNPHYHQPSDTPDTLDYGRLSLATAGTAGAVARLARAKYARQP